MTAAPRSFFEYELLAPPLPEVRHQSRLRIPKIVRQAVRVQLAQPSAQIRGKQKLFQPLKPPQTKMVPANFGARRILSVCLKTEFELLYSGVVLERGRRSGRVAAHCASFTNVGPAASSAFSR